MGCCTKIYDLYAVWTMYRVGHAIHTCTILMEDVVDSNGTNMDWFLLPLSKPCENICTQISIGNHIKFAKGFQAGWFSRFQYQLQRIRMYLP